jgi:flagellar M-ring protein FliF
MAESSVVVAPEMGGLTSPSGRAMQALSTVQNFLKQPAVVRAAPMIVVTLVVAIGLVLILFMRDPAMVTLFPRLGEEDKAQVIQILSDQGIKAKLDSSTGQVTVPRTDFYRAKMLLAANGLPKAAVSGYDLLTQLPIGTSRSVEQAKLKQAQESELARSIMEIRDIEGARVHLAVPERSAFVRDQTPPSASVFVKLAPGRQLSTGQVQSIVNLVSSSVPFLPVANVTLVDQFGTLLTTPQRDAEIGLTAQQLEHRIRVEKILRERVMNLLTPIVGQGNVNTEVNVEMDFTRTEQTRETYDPDKNVVRSEQESIQETSEGRARGVPGATSNQPPTTPQLATTPTPGAGTTANAANASNAANDGPKNKQSNSLRNYEVSREVKSTRPALGEVRRISVAVLLRAGVTTDANGKQVEKPLPDDERARLTDLLQEAVGYDKTRGDRVAIVSSGFVDEQPLLTRSWYDAPWLEDAVKQILVLLVLAVIVLGALKPFLSRLMTTSEVVAAGDDPLLGQSADSIEVRQGETLEDIKARLKPKKAAISAEMLDTANTYDDKVMLIRMLVGDDAARVTAVMKNLIQRDLN